MPMIRSFAFRETERIWAGLRSRKLPPDIQDKPLVKLAILNRAQRLEEIRSPPGNRLEKLQGNRANQYSSRINYQWRVCFRWTNAGANDVEITDYH